MAELTPISLPEMYIIGITTRTTNQNEMNPSIAQIPALWQRFFQEQIATRIPNRTNPQRMLALYTDYESDEHGLYSLILGCEVSSFDTIPEGMVAKTIPPGSYVVYTTRKGPVTEIVPEAWSAIWAMDASQSGGVRRFSGDFEVYDERSQNPEDAQVAIYIAVQ